MGFLILGVKVVSAEGLINEMNNNVYVMVTLKGGAFSDQKAQTEVDIQGGQNPRWNSLINFMVDPSLLTEALNSHLTFTVVSQNLLGDKNVGEIKVSIKELIQSAGQGCSMQNVSYPVKENGKFNFAYKFINPQPQVPMLQKQPTHVQQAQASMPELQKQPPHVQVAQAPAAGTVRVVGTNLAVGLGVNVTGAYICKNLFHNEAAASGTKTSSEELNSSSFYEHDGLSGNEISAFLDTSAVDPTASFNENLFGDGAGLSSSEIAAFLNPSTIDPTANSFDAFSNSFAGNLNYDEAADPSGIATAAFSDTSVVESTNSVGVWESLLTGLETMLGYLGS